MHVRDVTTESPAHATQSLHLRNLTVSAVMLVPFVVLLAAVFPLGAYPSNDDPFYGKPVEWWVESSRLQPVSQHGALTASSLGHVAFGALVCSVLGWSYTHLCIAAISQQWLGATALYLAMLDLNVNPRLSFWGAFTFALNPWYFGHAFTFMTDGPAAAWTCIAIFGFVRGFTRAQLGWIVVGSLAVAIGAWYRQTNLLVLIVPLACWTVYRLRRDRSRSTLVLLGGLVLPVAFSVVLLESSWISPPTLSRVADIAPRANGIVRLKEIAISLYGLALLIGFWMLPLLPWLFKATYTLAHSLPMHLRRRAMGATLCIAAMPCMPFIATLGRACLTNSTGPFVQNGHLGPIFLSDMDEPGRWGELAGVAWPLAVWQLASALSLVSLTVLIAHVVFRITEHVGNRQLSLLRTDGAPILLGLVCMVSLTVPIFLVLVSAIMDRYWLLILPPAILAISLFANIAPGSSMPYGLRFSSGAILAGLFLFNLVMIHDLWSWNRVRWQQVQQWLAMGWAPQDFDGGRDVNAWLRMDEDPATSSRLGDQSKWWSGLAHHSISSGPRPGWKEVDRLPFFSWATLKTHYLLVLQKEPESSSRIDSRIGRRYSVERSAPAIPNKHLSLEYGSWSQKL